MKIFTGIKIDPKVNGLPSLIGCSGAGLSKELATIFLQLIVGDKSHINAPFTKEVADEIGIDALLLFFRIQKAKPTLTITVGLALFLTCLAEGNPGNLVMWAWTCKAMQVAKGIENQNELISLDDWAGAFPMGVPTEDEYHIVWTSQKTETGANQLDNLSVWVT